MSRTTRIALVGTGQMGRSTMSVLAKSDANLRFLAIDRSAENLEAARAISPAVEAAPPLDIEEDPLPIGGSDLVLNFAGPFFGGSTAVARASLAAGVPYVDVGDDVEGTRAILSLDDEAQRAGVPLITGAGLSPGVSNWLACRILSKSPDCDEIKIVWVVHEPDPGGLAPLRHMLHMAVAPCPIWQDGTIVETPGFVPATAETFDMPEPFGATEAFDTAHPEPLTLGRQFPRLRAIRCKGSLRPNWANAAFSTLGRIGFGYAAERVDYGDISIEPAEFLWRLMWQRYRRKPTGPRSATTMVRVMGLREGRVIDSRTVADDGDMSRGTGVGVAAAALTLLTTPVPAGAAGVERLSADTGLDHFLRLTRERGWFRRGILRETAGADARIAEAR